MENVYAECAKLKTFAKKQNFSRRNWRKKYISRALYRRNTENAGKCHIAGAKKKPQTLVRNYLIVHISEVFWQI